MAKSLFGLSDEALWKLFPVILSESRDEWRRLYLQEKISLENVIGKERIARINHYGSTSVPGLLAKPTIDILLELKSTTDLTHIVSRVASIEFVCVKFIANPDPNIVLLKGYTPSGFKGQTFHVHLRRLHDWDELYFRDYLMAHPETAAEYGKLKMQLKQEHEFNRDAYRDAKTAFVKEITQIARQEFGGHHRLDNCKAPKFLEPRLSGDSF
jgi:GrpB-like predicted nucleotidyltransferase (UPF0157 family)